MPTIEQLGKSLLGTLNDILTGGDERVPAPINSKISWCQPGIPFMPEDFEFAANGLGNATDPEHTRKLLKQAFNFSTAVDFIPDVTGTYVGDQQQTIYRTSQARMSHVYGEILRFSKVVQSELTDEQKAKLEKFRGLLFKTKVIKNEVTGEDKEVTEPGTVSLAYNEAKSKYLEVSTNYQNKRVRAMTATGVDGAAAQLDFAFNGENYYATVKSAMDNWTTMGYRNEVEDMNAYINQVTQRSMMLWKERLLNLYERGSRTELDSNSVFNYTTVVPGNFATSNGWTGFSFSHEQIAAHSDWSTSSWSGGAGIGFGFWRVGGGAGGSTQSSRSDLNITNFRISFELVQTLIVRPWFYPEFFLNRGWTLRKGEGWNYLQYPSDGKPIPDGIFIGYPTQVIFVRNLVIESEEFASAFSQHSEEFHGGGSIGWGPFSISGSYSKASGGQDFNMTRDGGKITVPGMQIIAFVNHLIPKSPNPLPEIPSDSFQ
jgi:hypothetical protein